MSMESRNSRLTASAVTALVGAALAALALAGPAATGASAPSGRTGPSGPTPTDDPPPAPPPPPGFDTGDFVRLPSGAEQVSSRGVVLVDLRCASDAGPQCAGTIALHATHHPPHEERSATLSRHRRRTRIAKRGFSVPSGQKEKLRLRISKLGRRLVCKRSTLRSQATVRQQAPGGAEAVDRNPLKLKRSKGCRGS